MATPSNRTESPEPRVSVVIPCFNGADLAPRAVESALAQTYPGLEVVVVDDGSTDDLAGALRPYMDRIRLVRHETNRGVADATNTGVAHASGALVTILDHDDWWPPDLVERHAPRVAPKVAIAYDLVRVDAEGVERTGRERSVLSAAAHWPWRSVDKEHIERLWLDAPPLKLLIRRSDFERAGGHDRRFTTVAHDFHFLVKLVASGVTIEVVDEPAGFYQRRSGSLTDQARREAELQVAVEWMEMHASMPRELPLNRAAVEACRRHWRYWRARHAEALIRRSVRSDRGGLVARENLGHVLPALPGVLGLQLAKVRRRLPRAVGT
jgi:glycosyltransferase involved in cell wall biosynthesis